MDLVRWIALLRYPLEIGSVLLAFAPALMVLQAWTTLPRQIPIRFSASGRPDRWGSRAQAWILPLFSLVVYGYLSRTTGTWAWIGDSNADVPAGAEILLILKPFFAFLMVHATGMLIRVARREEEALNGWLMAGLMILLVTPPLALSMAVR